ncbi:MAG: hypothetical protein Q7S99_03190 [Parvibaculum sp.]|nr:hypothetical protein [Parvibaculum sp.]
MTHIDGSKRIVRVDAKKFAAAAIFRCHEETRYYLNGIYVEPHHESGVIMVATDGHRMAVIHDPTGYANAPFICKASPRFYAACARRGAKRDQLKRPGQVQFIGRTAYLTCEGFDDDVSIIGVTHLEIEYAPEIDGTYPNWRRVMPMIKDDATCAAPRFGVNAAYVADFATALTIISGMKTAIVTMTVDSDAEFVGSPIAVTSNGVPEFFGVLMPARADLCPPRPAWLTLPAPQKNEAAE